MHKHKLEFTIAYVKLHIAIILFGFTAILGKLISLEQIGLVWNRLWISSLGLIILPGVIHGLKVLSKNDIWRFSGIGILVAIHWITFYGSIKLGNNASITLACLATTPLFTSLLEPFISKRRILKTEVLLSIITIIGVYFVTGAGSFYYPAIITAIISAFFASTFSTLNKKYIAHHNSMSVSFVELFSGWLFIGLLLPIYFNTDPNFSIIPSGTHALDSWSFNFLGLDSDWYYLILLGLLCTSLAFVYSLQALKYVSAFTSNLAINLEPVYGIILAAFIFKENNELNFEFYLGACIILSCVVLHPILQKIEKRRERNAKPTSHHPV